MNRPRTVFMGTPDIAVPALRVLARHSEVACVVTQPDRPAGRGQHLQPPPIKCVAEELGLALWQPETLKGQADAPQLAGADLFVVMAYGELLRQEVLDLPRAGCINLHASLLPRWRGASPLQAALRAGDDRTGVALMRMVRALDAGPVHLVEEIPIEGTTTLPALHDAVAGAAAIALERFLAAWPSPPPALAQDERLVTFCRKLTADDGHLDFARTAVELERWVRAYTPIPGCWALAAGGRLRILELAPRPAIVDLPPGRLLALHGEIVVGCGDGACALLRVQPPGGRAMSGGDFLNGHDLPERLA